MSGKTGPDMQLQNAQPKHYFTSSEAFFGGGFNTFLAVKLICWLERVSENTLGPNRLYPPLNSRLNLIYDKWRVKVSHWFLQLYWKTIEATAFLRYEDMPETIHFPQPLVLKTLTLKKKRKWEQFTHPMILMLALSLGITYWILFDANKHSIISKFQMTPCEEQLWIC